MSSDYGSENKGGANQRPRYYEILCIPHDATGEQIKSAYRKRARETHPDVNPGIDREEFQLVSEAYQVLSDEAKRALYDRSLRTPESVRPNARPQPDNHKWNVGQREYVHPQPEYRSAPKEDPAMQEKLKREEEAYFQKKQANSQEYQDKQKESAKVYKEKKDENEIAYRSANTKNEKQLEKELAACEEMRKQFLRQPGNNMAADAGYYVARDKAFREFYVRKDQISREYCVNKDRIEREYIVNKDRIEREYIINKDRIDREYLVTKLRIEQGSYTPA